MATVCSCCGAIWHGQRRAWSSRAASSQSPDGTLPPMSASAADSCSAHCAAVSGALTVSALCGCQYSLSQASRSGAWRPQLVAGLLSVLWLLNAYNLLLSVLGILPLTAASPPSAPFSASSFLGLSSLLLLPASLTLTVFRYDEVDDAMDVSFIPLMAALAGAVLSLLALLLFAYHRQLFPALLLSHPAPPVLSVLLLLFSSVCLGFHRWRHGRFGAARYDSMEDWDGSSAAVQADGYGVNGTRGGTAGGGGKGRLSREYEALLRGADDFTVEDDEDGVSIF